MSYINLGFLGFQIINTAQNKRGLSTNLQVRVKFWGLK